MKIGTGTTVIENILSLDINNNPISAATFNLATIKDGVIYTATTIIVSLVSADKGIFSASWSADTIGFYQIYLKNNNTTTVFLSEIVNVVSDSELQQNIYIGL